MKYPVLIVGIIFFAIFVTSPKTKDFWRKINRRNIPSTCDAVKDRVEKKAPSTWSFDCPTTQFLIIDIQHNPADRNYLKLRQEMYKELANSYVKLGNLSNKETLNYLPKIHMKLIHPSLSINSQTDGQAVVELTKKKSQQDIATHLKLTVTIKEKRK